MRGYESEVTGVREDESEVTGVCRMGGRSYHVESFQFPSFYFRPAQRCLDVPTRSNCGHMRQSDSKKCDMRNDVWHAAISLLHVRDCMWA